MIRIKKKNIDLLFLLIKYSDNLFLITSGIKYFLIFLFFNVKVLNPFLKSFKVILAIVE